MNIPITKPYFGNEELQAVKESLESGWVAQGPKTISFEKKFAAFINTKHAVATTSCTTALHLALIAKNIGVGNDVILPSFTFVATANAIEYTGATPVFCDIKKETYNIDCDKLESLILDKYKLSEGRLANKINKNILKAIIPVHLFGLAADMQRINMLAEKYSLTVIEDAACALGAAINGTHAGAFGNIACFSLHPRKAITCGEGGVAVTDDLEVYEKITALRNHGATVSDLQRHQGGGWLLPDYKMVGYNYRITDIQGAVIDVQMDKLEYILNRRKELAKRYDEMLRDIDWLVTPSLPAGYAHGYQSYVCLVDYKKLGLSSIQEAHIWRNTIMKKLEQDGIATRQGTHAVHMLDYYKQKYCLTDDMLPNAYEADRLSIALPLYVTMTEVEQNYVVESIKKLAL